MKEEGRRRGSRRERSQELEPKREVATVRCPFCHDDVPQDALAVKCGRCATVHHTSCFDEKGGCSVDGCGGKAAQVVKGWRAALGECRGCRGKVYLDENVVVCSSCDSFHHPQCLEARDGCAECGSGDGILVRGDTVQSARGGGAGVTLFVLSPIALGVLGTIALIASGAHVAVGLPICMGGGLVPIFGLLARKWERRRTRRLLAAQAEKVKAVAPPPPKPES